MYPDDHPQSESHTRSESNGYNEFNAHDESSAHHESNACAKFNAHYEASSHHESGASGEWNTCFDNKLFRLRLSYAQAPNPIESRADAYHLRPSMKSVRPRKQRAKPLLSLEELEKFEIALDDFDGIDTYDLSEAEVTTDNLASALRRLFFKQPADPFVGTTPTLYEVVEALHRRFGLTEDAVDSAHDLKNRLEDTYRHDRDDEISAEVKQAANDLGDYLKNFVEQKPHE